MNIRWRERSKDLPLLLRQTREGHGGEDLEPGEERSHVIMVNNLMSIEHLGWSAVFISFQCRNFSIQGSEPLKSDACSGPSFRAF